MSKLQKSAWFNFGFVTVGSVIAILCLAFAAGRIEEGFNYINVIICVVAISIAVPVVLMIHRKKSYEAGFDEREKIINRRATVLSFSGLAVFLYLACFIPFVAFGGGNTIKIIYLPVTFICAAFTAQLFKSAAIIIQCAMEGENG